MSALAEQNGRARETHVLLKVVCAEEQDLVVETLCGEPFAVRVLANGGHRMHARLGDDFDRDGNVKVPHAHRLVV